MGYFPTLGPVVFLLIHSIGDISCITSRRDVEDHVRISRTQTEEPPLTDWEIGLREAAHQALLRDGYTDPSLRGYLQNAPFSGKQAVKVFGDIAILARGQLYATPVGFSFVQDPYHNDCDGCHNDRKCRGDKCDHYVPYGTQQLVALWTVKRIRHRDINYGYRYEVEYTISPVDRALKDGFITKNGKFDYGIPGHVFVIKSNPRYVSGYEHNEFYSSPDQVKWHRQYVPRPPSHLYHPVLITNAHNSHPSPQPQHTDELTRHDNNLKEIQLYKNLVNSLSAKTSTTRHRFKIDPTSSSPRTSINRVVLAAAPTSTTYQITPPRRTTLVQLPNGQIVPATEVSTATTPDGQLQILTPVQVSSLQNEDVHFVPSSPLTITEVTKYTEAGILKQIPSTKIPIFIMKELIPPSSPSARPEVVKDMGSTKLPKKTTIHFFAAEDVDKTAQEEKHVNDIFTKKYATRKEFTKRPQQKTTKRYDGHNEDNFYPDVKPTEAMRRVTETPYKETSPEINQISRPYKESATTQSLSSSSSSTIEQPTFYRSTTTSYSTTTETPSTYGTQRTTLTLPIPSTFNQQRETAYGMQTTPILQRNTGNTIYNYNVRSTQEPSETILTVTPVPTIPSVYSSPDESTLTTYEHTQGSNNEHTTERRGPSAYEHTQGSNNEHTTERRGPSSGTVLSRTTLVYPSTPMDDGTTLSSRTDTVLTRHEGIATAPTYTEPEPTTESIFNPPSLNTIITYYGPQTTDYHNVAYSPTETATVLPTTPATKMTTAIFKSSKTIRLPTTKLKTTTINDFLGEELSEKNDSKQIRLSNGNFQDYTDEDVFEPSEPKTENKFNSYKPSSKIYKTSFTTEPTRTVAKTPRIIYSDFYEASTVPPTTSLTQFYAESQNNYITQSMDATTQRLPSTSQSYLTSISYKVNKKRPSISDELEVLPTIKAKLSNLHTDEKLQIFRAELPETEENTTKKSEEKEAFDNIALQLVNHARGLELLNKKPLAENRNPIQEKKNLKYRRRLYMPKSRKNNTLKTKTNKDQ